MRRIKAKEIDKSKEKERRDNIVRSIAVEQGVKTSLDLQNKELEKRIELLKKEMQKDEDASNKARENKKKFQNEELKAFEKLKNTQAKIIECEEKVATFVSKIEELQSLISELGNTYANEKSIIIAVRNKENEEHARHITNLRSQIVNMEDRVSTLNKLECDISNSIQDKILERAGVERTLQFRLQELSRVNMTVDSTKSEYEKAKEEYELWGRRLDDIKMQFKKADKDVESKTAEIRKKEKEVENMRGQLVALMAREKKIDERSEIIRDLFERAGLNAKL